LTHNPAYLYLDEEYCRTQTEFGRRIVNSGFTLGLMVGISVGDTTSSASLEPHDTDGADTVIRYAAEIVRESQLRIFQLSRAGATL